MLCNIVNIHAQNRLIPVRHLKKDVRFYFSTIEKTHPDCYAFASENEVSAARNNLLNELTRPLHAWELSRLIEMNTNFLFDNHTKMHLIFYHPEKNISLLQDILFFPWQITIEDTVIYLIDNQIKKEIISINQHSSREVLNKMLKIFSADISMENKIEDISSRFPLYYYFTYLENSIFNVKVVDNNSDIKELEQQGITLKEVKEVIPVEDSFASNENFRVDFFTDSIALLHVNTFASEESNVFETFLSNSFNKIAEKKCKYLFVNIKNNSGGSSANVALLMDYLFHGEYYIFGSCDVKRRSKAYIREYETRLTKKKNKHLLSICSYGFFERTREIQHPFLGTLFILQGAGTRSAALDLSAAIKTSRRGILVGKPTGEPACSYSQGLAFQLPYSKLKFQCATGYFAMSSGTENNLWITPDIDLDFTQFEFNIANFSFLIKNAREKYPSFFRN
jgi:hypothetical protein